MEFELHLLPVVTWINYLNPLRLSFCICKMGIIVVDAWVVVRSKEIIEMALFIICCSHANVRAFKENFFRV